MEKTYTVNVSQDADTMLLPGSLLTVCFKVRMLKDYDPERLKIRQLYMMKSFGPKYDPLGEA